MRGRSARAANAAHLASLGRAVSCVARTVLIETGPRRGMSRTVTLADNLARLRAVPQLYLLVDQGYAVEQDDGGAWNAEVIAYRYAVQDGTGQEVVAWHWHPTGDSPITWPHLHSGGAVGDLDLRKRHLPTGFVTLQAVLRCLITEFGVEPLRRDWQVVLADPS